MAMRGLRVFQLLVAITSTRAIAEVEMQGADAVLTFGPNQECEIRLDAGALVSSCEIDSPPLPTTTTTTLPGLGDGTGDNPTTSYLEGLGWKKLWEADSEFNYLTPVEKHVLVGFKPEGGETISNAFFFEAPETWKGEAFFLDIDIDGQTCWQDAVTVTRFKDSESYEGTLRVTDDNYPDWFTSCAQGGQYGRFGLLPTTGSNWGGDCTGGGGFPGLSGYTGGTVGHCNLSCEDWNSQSCYNEKRFIMYTRND
jgi:hypothetical protein